MKKMLLTVAVCLASSFGFAEVTPPTFSISGEPQYIPENYQSIKYIVIDKSEGQQIMFEYYDPKDFSLIKQINFTIQETGYEYRPQVILDQFVFVRGINFSYEDNNRNIAKLYDTKGNIIYDFGVANSLYTSVSVMWNDGYTIWQLSSNKILFMIARQVYLEKDMYEDIQEFYYLTINETESGVKSVSVEKKAAFPCPAREVVNIPTSAERGHLHIRNTNGKIVKSQPINGAEYQQVNTSNFPAGTYIYQTEAESGSFIVK